MDKNNGLVLEGGAMRSIFTAGVLDYFLDMGVKFPNVLAISASAYAGVNYISGQTGRCVDCLVEPLREYKFLGFKTFLKKGTFFDMDFLFDEVPHMEKNPFDFESFKKFDGRFITSAIDCNTGENVFFEDFDTEERLFKVCRVANSMPILARITELDGRQMLDGGMADAIPVAKAIEEGWEKIVVVLTRDTSYKKREGESAYTRIIRLIYRKYPKLVETILHRGKKYNDTLEVVSKLEKEGRAFVIRPSDNNLKNGENDADKLKEYYKQGYDAAKASYNDMMAFLQG